MSSQVVKSEMVDAGSGFDGGTGRILQESVVTSHLENTGILSSEAELAANGGAKPKTPRKRAPKKATAEQNDAADGTPVKAPKSTPKKRVSKAIKQEDGAGSDASPFITPQKRGSAAKGDEKDGTTPSKKRAPAKNPYPTCRAELSEADRLMVQMKKEGKGWTEIGAAYSKITGEPLGKSTLSNRYPKIMAALVDWEQGDIERMLHLKDTIDKETEEEIAEFKRKAEYDIWKKISGRMTTIGGGSYPPDAIEKGYMKERKEGFPHRATVFAVMNSAAIGAGQQAPGTNGAEASDAIHDAANDSEEDANIDEDMDHQV